MKSDLDKFIKLYKSIGVKLKAIKQSNGDYSLTLGGNTKATIKDTRFKNQGFFYTEIFFDSSGRFKSQFFAE